MPYHDKRYISSELEKYGYNVEIVVGSTYSDHMLVKIMLVHQRRPARDYNLRINSKLFQDAKVGRDIRSIWESNLVGCSTIDKLRGRY